MVRNDGFDIWHAAVAQFYCVTVENFVEGTIGSTFLQRLIEKTEHFLRRIPLARQSEGDSW